jgi:two-component system CheB/CheR fusion protein
VRVWVPACATGEEAFSIAMLLAEHARTLDEPPSVQVFATDLDEQSIATARNALYPETIEADVSHERLARHFVKQHLGYRVRREIRETVLFAVHDLLKDSPFSRLDLVSCRNLLIYLTREAQARALDVFHFALRQEGKLFLGASESVDEESPRFTVIDKKSRLFRQRPMPRAKLPVLPGPSTLALNLAETPKGVRPIAGSPASSSSAPPACGRRSTRPPNDVPRRGRSCTSGCSSSLHRRRSSSTPTTTSCTCPRAPGASCRCPAASRPRTCCV